MTYAEFRRWAIEGGYTSRELRCDDAPPSDELLEVMDRVGLAKYETFVNRFAAESMTTY